MHTDPTTADIAALLTEATALTEEGLRNHFVSTDFPTNDPVPQFLSVGRHVHTCDEVGTTYEVVIDGEGYDLATAAQIAAEIQAQIAVLERFAQ